ncbi:MAG: hypothetical protein Q4D38_10345, partial [Planctomycetia bacterium]|nr:hypothetical protein [Planctomycetia bacterium]
TAATTAASTSSSTSLSSASLRTAFLWTPGTSAASTTSATAAEVSSPTRNPYHLLTNDEYKKVSALKVDQAYKEI